MYASELMVMIAQGIENYGDRHISVRHLHQKYNPAFDSTAVSRDDNGIIDGISFAIEALPYSLAMQEESDIPVSPTFQTKAVPITPVIANQVLYHFRSGGYQAGQFMADLIALIAKADHFNKRKLGWAFPDYTRAVRMAQEDDDGIAVLKEIAAGDTRC